MALFRKRSAADSFSREAVAILRQMPDVERIVPNGELSLRVLVRGNPQPQVVNLHNHFHDLAELPDDERVHRLTMALASVGETREHPESFADAHESLMPSLRNMSYVASPMTPDGSATPPEVRPKHVPYLPFIVQLLVIDNEHSLSPVQIGEFDEWDVTWDEASRVAHHNLLVKGMDVQPSRTIRGAIEVLGPDAYQAALLTVPEALSAFALEAGLTGPSVSSALIAFAPSRDDLLLLGDADVHRLAEAIEWAHDRYDRSSRRLSTAAFEVSPDGVVPWRPAADHPLREPVRTAHRYTADVEYRYQKTTLDELFNKAGEDLFVASYKLGRRRDASTFAYAAWVEGVTAGLLPEVDFVGLVGEDESSFVVTWADAHRIAGRWLPRDPNLDPPRWRVSGWPPADVVERLREVATSIHPEEP